MLSLYCLCLFFVGAIDLLLDAGAEPWQLSGWGIPGFMRKYVVQYRGNRDWNRSVHKVS